MNEQCTQQSFTRKNLCYRCQIWAAAKCCYLKPTTSEGKQCPEFEPKAEQPNKFSAEATYSKLIGRGFDSKLEARRAEELKGREIAGAISDLEYQVPIILSEYPRVSLHVDFRYKDQDGKIIWEDSKGKETREFRVKRIWAKQLYGIDILLTGVKRK
jgi:hypothetical protein